MKLATYVERVPVCKYATSLTVTYDGSPVHGCTRITRVHRVRVCRTRVVSKLKAANFVSMNFAKMLNICGNTSPRNDCLEEKDWRQRFGNFANGTIGIIIISN